MGWGGGEITQTFYKCCRGGGMGGGGRMQVIIDKQPQFT